MRLTGPYLGGGFGGFNRTPLWKKRSKVQAKKNFRGLLSHIGWRPVKIYEREPAIKMFTCLGQHDRSFKSKRSVK